MNTNAPARLRETPVHEIHALMFPIRASSRRNTTPGTQSSSSSNSPESFKSDLQSKRQRATLAPTPTLATMPTEMQEAICKFVSQDGLRSLMLSNSNLTEVVAQYLYKDPEFASTYRFAQFTFTVVNRPHYAQMVRCLDVSKFYDPRESNGERAIMAGWREFKYRHHDMFAVHRPSSPTPLGYRSLEKAKAQGLPFSLSSSTHPAPSPQLSSFHQCRDVPIGGICHVLHSCTRIQHLNLSRLHLASDYIVNNPAINRPSPSQVTCPNFYICEPEQSKAAITFLSDAPKSWTWQANELVPIYADAIIRLICRLRELETLTAQRAVWLNTNRVRKLLSRAQREDKAKGVAGLTRVDFRGSGMWKDLGWEIRGRRERVERIVGQLGETYEETIS